MSGNFHDPYSPVGMYHSRRYNQSNNKKRDEVDDIGDKPSNWEIMFVSIFIIGGICLSFQSFQNLVSKKNISNYGEKTQVPRQQIQKQVSKELTQRLLNLYYHNQPKTFRAQSKQY